MTPPRSPCVGLASACRSFRPVAAALFLSLTALVLAVSTTHANTVAPFSVELRGEVGPYTVAARATGVSLGMKVHHGARRLILAIQSDAVYSFLASGTVWAKVYNTTNDAHWHVLRVVDAAGTARPSCDGGTPVATWRHQADTNYARCSSWFTGSTVSPDEARIDWVNVNKSPAQFFITMPALSDAGIFFRPILFFP